jgi:predicted Zn-dependent protease
MTQETKKQFSEAVRLKDAGQPEAAKEILKQLLREDPKCTAALAVLGHIYWEQGRLDVAVEIFQCAVNLSPKLEAVSLGLFHSLWKLERFDEAFEEMKRFQTISDSQNYRDIIDEINKES